MVSALFDYRFSRRLALNPTAEYAHKRKNKNTVERKRRDLAFARATERKRMEEDEAVEQRLEGDVAFSPHSQDVQPAVSSGYEPTSNAPGFSKANTAPMGAYLYQGSRPMSLHPVRGSHDLCTHPRSPDIHKQGPHILTRLSPGSQAHDDHQDHEARDEGQGASKDTQIPQASAS